MPILSGMVVGLVAEKVRSAQSVVLSTHRQSDGDGLGAEIALYHALVKAGKSVRILNVDLAPRKYSFMGTEHLIEVYGRHQPLASTDLALILDTNDQRLVEPVFDELKARCREVLFIDHHPELKHGPAPTPGSLIDTRAASTGELAYRLIKELGIELDPVIARALYTSLVFDTHLFRYVRSAPESHLMAAEILRFEARPEEVHRHLFATYSVRKMRFFAHALAKAEYLAQDRVAILCLAWDDVRGHDLGRDESFDVIDLIMNIESIEAAALIREDAPGRLRISLRSRGPIEVFNLAESFGGGGHLHSAGAQCEGKLSEVRDQIAAALVDLVTLTRPGSPTK